MSVYDTLIQQASAQYGVPVANINAVINAESSFNPTAVSPAGAQGLMQLMPATAASLGVTDPFDPAQNINAGTRYLAQQYDRFGSWDKAYAAYNAGPGNVEKYGGVPPFAETQAYVRKLMDQPGTNTPGTPRNIDYGGVPTEPHSQQLSIYDPNVPTEAKKALLAFRNNPSVGQYYANRAVAAQRPVSGGVYGQGGSGPALDASKVGYDFSAYPRNEGEAIWQWLQRIGQQEFGLRNDPGIGQTYGGVHAPGSPHYAGRAIDFGDALNTFDQLNQANQYFSQIPGVSTIWQSPGHYDHLDVRVL